MTNLHGVLVLLDAPAASVRLRTLLEDELAVAHWAGPLRLGRMLECRGRSAPRLLLAWDDAGALASWWRSPRVRALAARAATLGAASTCIAGALELVDADWPATAVIAVERVRLAPNANPRETDLGAPRALAALYADDGAEAVRWSEWPDEQACIDYLAGIARGRRLSSLDGRALSVNTELARLVPENSMARESRSIEAPLTGVVDVLDDSPWRELRPLYEALERDLPVLGLSAAPSPVFFIARTHDVHRVLAACGGTAAWRSSPGIAALPPELTSRLDSPVPPSIVARGVAFCVTLFATSEVPRIELATALVAPLCRFLVDEVTSTLPPAGGWPDADAEQAWHGLLATASRTLEAALLQRLAQPGVAVAPMRWASRVLPGEIDIAGVRLARGTQVLLNFRDAGAASTELPSLPLWMQELPPLLRLLDPALAVVRQTLDGAGIGIVVGERAPLQRDRRFDAPAVLVGERTSLEPSRHNGASNDERSAPARRDARDHRRDPQQDEPAAVHHA